MLAAGFAGLLEQAVTHGPLTRLDLAVRDHVQALVALRPVPGLDALAEYWTDLGSAAVAVPLLTLAAGAASLRARRAGTGRWWRPALTALLGVSALLVTVVPLKELIARVGPDGLLPADGGDFPSGHTATATVCLFLAGRLIAGSRRAAALTSSALCLGVGAGLLWRNYHWLTDVLAAWCLSGVILWTLLRTRG